MTSAAYTLYHNLSARMWRPAKPGDHLVIGWSDTFGSLGRSTYDLDTPEGVCGAVFHRHNLDQRPDGQLAPSASVGDVIALARDGHPVQFWTVDRIGFAPVLPEAFASMTLHEGPYREAIERPGVRAIAWGE